MCGNDDNIGGGDDTKLIRIKKSKQLNHNEKLKVFLNEFKKEIQNPIYKRYIEITKKELDLLLNNTNTKNTRLKRQFELPGTWLINGLNAIISQNLGGQWLVTPLDTFLSNSIDYFNSKIQNPQDPQDPPATQDPPTTQDPPATQDPTSTQNPTVSPDVPNSTGSSVSPNLPVTDSTSSGQSPSFFSDF